MAADSSLDRTTANLVLSRGITASKFGNCPESLRVLSVRWPTRKNSVCSSSANSTFSASVFDSNCCSSCSALRGISTRFSPLMPSRISLGFSTYDSRCPSVATMASDSALITSSAPFSV